MVLLSFFEISSSFWSTKKLIRLGLHVSPRTLCIRVLVSIQKIRVVCGAKYHEKTYILWIDSRCCFYHRNRWKLWLLEAKSVLAMPHGTYSSLNMPTTQNLSITKSNGTLSRNAVTFARKTFSSLYSGLVWGGSSGS